MRMRAGVARLALWVCALLCAAAHAQAPLQAFDAGTPAALRARHAGQPYVLAFWSTTCEPCREEMPVFRALQRKYPGVPIHLVAADPPGEQAAINAFLKRYDPGRVSRWAFADEFAERVRHAIDPAWRGELPRTYLFDARHVPETITGRLEPARLEAWMRAQARPAAR